MLYEVAATCNSKVDKDGNMTAPEELVIAPKFQIAASPEAAVMDFTIDNAAKLKEVDKLRLQILVRPFAR